MNNFSIKQYIIANLVNFGSLYKDYFYCFYYPYGKYQCVNKLLVIGLLRKYFNYKLFWYIKLS
jgi:hypothetical protein